MDQIVSYFSFNNIDKYSLILITVSVFLFLFYWFIILKYNFIAIKIITTIIFLIYIFSFIFLFLKNPGIPGREYYKKNFKIIGKERKNYKKCSKCNIIIPKSFKVVHCQRCEICVKNQDHHCPWASKCIGENNLNLFYTFVCSLTIFFISLFISFTTCIIYVVSILR